MTVSPHVRLGGQALYPSTHYDDSFELYERGTSTSKSDKEFAIRLSLSEGAHSSNVLDSAIDARHALNVQGRKCVPLMSRLYPPKSLHRRLTDHLAYSLVLEKLSKHFGRVPEVGAKCLKKQQC